MTVENDAGWSTCPMCKRRWLVTRADDCMMPACGHYGRDASRDNPARPCEPCGIAHAWRCEALGNDPDRPLPTRTVYVKPPDVGNGEQPPA